MKTAYRIRHEVDDQGVEVNYFRLDPPLPYMDKEIEYVMVRSVTVRHDYITRATADGEIIGGHFYQSRNGLSALETLGYTISGG